MKSNSSREQLKKAKESLSKIWPTARKTAIHLWKLLLESGKATAYALDGVDRWIGSKIQTKNILLSRMKDHLLKLALAGGLFFHYAPNASNQSYQKIEKSESESHLVQGIGMSHYNNCDFKQFRKENDKLRNDGDVMTPPISFMLVRATQGVGKYQNWLKKGKNLNDRKFWKYISEIQAYNTYCDQDEKLAFATYHLYVPGHWVKEQVDNYWNTVVDALGDIEARKQTPILDIEMDDINKSKDKGALFENLLQWCQLAEQKFWRKPLIYTSYSAIKDYFRKDKRFAEYQYWAASYGKNNITPELVQQQWWTPVLSENDIIMHQFTENGTVPWMWNSQWKTDINVISRDDYQKYFAV